MKDALGQTIQPGDLVAYSRRISSSLYIERRRVHSVVKGKGVKMYAVEGKDGSGVPSRTYADSGNMVVVTRQFVEEPDAH